MPRMNTEIARLEEQLEQLVSRYEAGRSELRGARARIAALESENRMLNEKVRGAAERLASILERLPRAEAGDA